MPATMRSSQTEEVEEARPRVQLALEHEHTLVLEHVAHLGIGIAQVAELAGTDRTDLDAGGVTAVAHALDAERALLDDALHARAVAEVVRLRVHLLGRDLGLGEVEV